MAEEVFLCPGVRQFLAVSVSERDLLFVQDCCLIFVAA
jgi:ABC-type dipeptide/oligopeptide/nickel transport system permease component